MKSIPTYLLSLPERVLRSATALAGGLVREIGQVTVPVTIRRSHLYQNLVEATLRFLIEQVGEVQQVYPTGEKLSENFLLRKTAGNGIELIGIVAFRASPVWVLAALADASGVGRYLIRDITDALKEAKLLDPDTNFTTVDEMLDGLEASSSRLASTVNAPPLDVAALRNEWQGMKKDLARIPPSRLPSLDSLRAVWNGMRDTASKEKRTVYEVSSLVALSSIAVSKTGALLSDVILDHYVSTLAEIRKTGYVNYAVNEFRPYLYAAASQFSPDHRSLTERLLLRKQKK